MDDIEGHNEYKGLHNCLNSVSSFGFFQRVDHDVKTTKDPAEKIESIDNSYMMRTLPKKDSVS